MNLLLLTLFIPLIGFFLLSFLPRDSKAAYPLTLIASLLTFVISLGLIGPVRENGARFTHVIDKAWITGPSMQIRFHLGVDGINLWLIVLSTFLLPIGIWMARTMIADRRNTFFALLLLFEFGLIGVFSAIDLFAFYVFWEVALVPMYLMVGGWGGAKRGAVAVKFFVYTFAGSILMLASILYLHSQAGSFDYADIMTAFSSGRVTLSATQQFYLFLGFFAAFAVKVPIFPFHTWQPDTYTEAPAPATFLLAAAMSKMGTYGLVRYSIALFPYGAHSCSRWIAVLAIIGIIYGALVALVQPNIKRLIAYSSLSHLGFIVLGIFTFNQQGADGAVYQMIAHGLSTGALFLLAGYMEQRRGSMEISDFGGIASAAPGLATAFLVALLASIGLPTLCNFVGEFLVLQGAALVRFSWAVWAAVGVILSSAYMLWMYQRTFLGKSDNKSAVFPDLTGRDWAPVVPLIVLMVWFGSYTQSFMPPISSATSHILDESRMNDEYRVKLVTPRSGQFAQVLHAR
ncbi:MAG: proton-translocating NADH-quinone oxidoreductase, chain [Bryobacterales bacterium]|jgi:NADH-quinone oxidoreductase subunit M|nr:proton-translocating NADH-quinone oxidoreductase, chain [Bryobacterales bacterium]